jgi:hypothetical protein
MTEQMMYELHTVMAAELANGGLTSQATIEATLSRVSGMGEDERQLLHATYRSRYPWLGGL